MAQESGTANERPTGTVTFLFTDIEGSTRRWEEQTADMREALARHDRTLGRAVEAHGGWLFKHTGDGILAAFASPKAAVLAALDAQRELELPVRMGIATGEAELRDDDYFGPTLNRAARIMASGHGRQVLLAQSTASLVDGVDLLDMGEHRLRDLSKPQRLYQLRAEGIESAFPALRTLDQASGNLPIQSTSFVGREDDLTTLVSAIGEHRLVTLTGVGGVGKTRLALQAAAAVGAEFSAGAWFIELAAVSDPGEVDRVVGAAAGALPPITRESLVDFLHGKRLLLVLDNCEHLLDACADLAETVLARCPEVFIVATSRESLGTPGEWAFRVPSLGFAAENASRAAEVAGAPAVELFVERARAAAPGFELSDAAAGDIAEVVRRLDGIPLAIELAAARLRMMSAAELREHLANRFRVLTGSRRGSVERHRTLKAAIDWSYTLLPEPAQQFARRLSVFTAGWTLEAAETVCSGGAVDEADILDLLTELVDKSLVQVDANERSGATRYRYLETIRVYMADCLDASGERPDTEHRYRDWALVVANSVPQKRWALRPQDEALLFAEWPNLVAAIERALDDGDGDTAARIAGNAGVVIWFGSGAYEQGLRLSTRALESGGGSDFDRFNLGCNIALLWQWSGEIDPARTWWNTVTELSRASDEISDLDLAPATATLALVDGDRRDALEAESMAAIAGADGTMEADYVLFILAFVGLLRGAREEFLRTMEAVWRRRRRDDFGPINPYLAQNYALALWAAGQGGATEAAAAAVERQRRGKNPPALLQALCWQAIIDPTQAGPALREARDLLRYHRASGFATYFFGAAARAAAEAGDPNRAARLLGPGRTWTPYSPSVHVQWERLAVGDLLDASPPSEVEALSGEGAGLSFDEALDLALPS